MAGTPGAASFGVPLITGVQAAAIAADNSVAAYVSKGQLYLATFTATSVRTAATGLNAAAADLLAWSSDSAVLAIHRSADRQITLYTGAGNLQLTPAGSLDVSALEGTMVRMVAGAGARNIVAITAMPRGISRARLPQLPAGNAYLLRAGESPLQFAGLLDPVAAAFSSDEQTVWFADDRLDALAVAGTASGHVEVLSGASFRDAVGLFGGSDGHLYAFSGRDALMRIVDEATENVTLEQKLPFTPSMTACVSSCRQVILRTRSGANDTTYLLSPGSSPSVFFVPAGGTN